MTCRRHSCIDGPWLIGAFTPVAIYKSVLSAIKKIVSLDLLNRYFLASPLGSTASAAAPTTLPPSLTVPIAASAARPTVPTAIEPTASATANTVQPCKANVLANKTGTNNVDGVTLNSGSECGILRAWSCLAGHAGRGTRGRIQLLFPG